jgi:Bicoid-interacting protein 3 (Bin3)
MNIEEKAAEKLDKMYVVDNLQKIVMEEKVEKPLENRFPSNVFFRIENFISHYLNVTEHYDTILCLSTTKWIHLNWGDDGIKRLFKKVYDSLYKGYLLNIFLEELQKEKILLRRLQKDVQIDQNSTRYVQGYSG